MHKIVNNSADIQYISCSSNFNPERKLWKMDAFDLRESSVKSNLVTGKVQDNAMIMGKKKIIKHCIEVQWKVCGALSPNMKMEKILGVCLPLHFPFRDY